MTAWDRIRDGIEDLEFSLSRPSPANAIWGGAR
jgi:hypothetical protein